MMVRMVVRVIVMVVVMVRIVVMMVVRMVGRMVTMIVVMMDPIPTHTNLNLRVQKVSFFKNKKCISRHFKPFFANIVFYQYPPSSHQGGWWLVCFCLFIVSTSGPVLTRKGTKLR